jgi:hypothetical protein
MSKKCCIFVADMIKIRHGHVQHARKIKTLFGQFKNMLYLCGEFGIVQHKSTPLIMSEEKQL